MSLRHASSDVFAFARTPFTAFVGLLAAMSVAHVLVRTSTYGGAMGTDAVSYMSTAANLMGGHGLQDFRGVGLFPWPPLFPVLVASVGVLGFEPLTAGRILNATAWGLVVLVSGLWLRRTISSTALAAGVATVLATSYPLAYHASHLNSELPFILFTLLALVALGRCMEANASKRALAAAVLCSGLATMTRYAGLALVLSGTLVLLWRAPWPPRRRLARACVYGAASVLPLGAWTARNWLLFGQWKLTGPNLSNYALLDLLEQLFRAPVRAVLPWDAPGWAVWIPWTIALAFVFTCVRAVVLKKRRGGSLSSARSGWPFGTFAVVYLLFLLFTVSRFSGIGLDQRFLLVAYVPFLLGGACIADRILLSEVRNWRAQAGRALEGAVVLACLAGIALGIRDNARTTRDALRDGFYGRSFNVASWDESEAIRFLKANPIDTPVYANHFGLLHAVLVLEQGGDVRGKYLTLPRQESALNDLDGNFHVVWFKQDGEEGYEYDHRDVAAISGAEVLADLRDGVILRIPGREDRVSKALDPGASDRPAADGRANVPPMADTP